MSPNNNSKNLIIVALLTSLVALALALTAFFVNPNQATENNVSQNTTSPVNTTNNVLQNNTTALTNTTKETTSENNLSANENYCDGDFGFGFDYPETWGPVSVQNTNGAPAGINIRKVSFGGAGLEQGSVNLNGGGIGLETYDLMNTQTYQLIGGVKASWKTYSLREEASPNLPQKNHLAVVNFSNQGDTYTIILSFGHEHSSDDDNSISQLLGSWTFNCQ